jgi:hypothetical protein
MPYNYFCETKERIFAEVKDAVPLLIEALIKPLREEEKRKETIEAKKQLCIALKGAFDEIQEYFVLFQWTDGLLIIPPTGEGWRKC